MKWLKNDPNATPDGFVDIPDYEGLYAINIHGDVFCYSKNRGAPGGTPAKMMKRSYDGHGYQRAYLTKNGKTVFRHVNAIMGEVFLSNPNGLPIVHHRDNNKQNNELENLEWVTYSRNIKLAYEDGLNYVSAKQKNASVQKTRSLSWEQAEEARRLYATGAYTQRDLQKKFGGDMAKLLRGDSYKCKEYV